MSSLFNTLRLLSLHFGKVILCKPVGLSADKTKQRSVTVRPEIKEFDDINKKFEICKLCSNTRKVNFIYRNIHLNYKLNSEPSKP